MKIINKLGPCRSLVLFSGFKWTVEIWRVAPCYDVPKHNHSNIDNWIFYIAGEAMVAKFSKKLNDWVRVWLNSSMFLKRFHIEPGAEHFIHQTNKALWLLTVQHWIDPHSNPVSVSENITFT